jgi:hypothetical protein
VLAPVARQQDAVDPGGAAQLRPALQRLALDAEVRQPVQDADVRAGPQRVPPARELGVRPLAVQQAQQRPVRAHAFGSEPDHLRGGRVDRRGRRGAGRDRRERVRRVGALRAGLLEDRAHAVGADAEVLEHEREGEGLDGDDHELGEGSSTRSARIANERP